MSIERSAVTAVLCTRGNITWRSSVDCDDAATVRDWWAPALRQLLDGIPEKLLRRTRVAVAIGPADAPVRRIRGLPHSASDRDARAIIANSSERFFLQAGSTLCIAAVHRAGGELWAGAAETQLIESISGMFVAKHIELASIIPAVAVQFRAWNELPAGVIRVHDGCVVSESSYDGAGLLATTRRFAAGDELTDRALPPGLEAPLEALGPAGLPFITAYAAAGSVTDGGFNFASAGAARHVSRRSLAAWAGVCAASVVVAFMAAPLLALRVQFRAERQLEAAAPAVERGTRSLQQAGILAAGYDAAHRFAASRRSPTLFLAALTQALSDSASLIDLRTDQAGGTLVARAPDALALLGVVSRMKELSAVRPVGAVTPESVGSTGMERITIAFSWHESPL